MSENPQATSGYVLGRRSKQNLAVVHPDLVAVIERGLQISGCDFAVTEGNRTKKRQRQLIKSGASRTMNSRHLPKTPRKNPTLGPVSHAVDLGAWVDGKLSWDWQYYYQIADAMKQAALELGVAIRWGGGWALLDAYPTAKEARQAYVIRKRKAGKKAFIDGPHFELDWKAYPIGSSS